MSEAPQANRTGRGPSVPTSSEARDRAMRELMTAPVIEAATVSALFDIGLQAALREAREGRWGAFKIGRGYRFPSPPVREALGLPSVPVMGPTSTDHTSQAA